MVHLAGGGGVGGVLRGDDVGGPGAFGCSLGAVSIEFGSVFERW